LEKIAEKGLKVLQPIIDRNTAENNLVEQLKSWILADLEAVKKEPIFYEHLFASVEKITVVK